MKKNLILVTVVFCISCSAIPNKKSELLPNSTVFKGQEEDLENRDVGNAKIKNDILEAAQLYMECIGD